MGGECAKNAEFMSAKCVRACGKCPQGTVDAAAARRALTQRAEGQKWEGAHAHTDAEGRRALSPAAADAAAGSESAAGKTAADLEGSESLQTASDPKDPGSDPKDLEVRKREGVEAGSESPGQTAAGATAGAAEATEAVLGLDAAAAAAAAAATIGRLEAGSEVGGATVAAAAATAVAAAAAASDPGADAAASAVASPASNSAFGPGFRPAALTAGRGWDKGRVALAAGRALRRGLRLHPSQFDAKADLAALEGHATALLLAGACAALLLAGAALGLRHRRRERVGPERAARRRPLRSV
ncbi:hypothetical protein T492DRAFT_1008638 [Pavlovales sp. CCMP2436]|nr:hypothetical protein T492DRAFT_1008638 [Pavlovales sp. CCMP2436]